MKEYGIKRYYGQNYSKLAYTLAIVIENAPGRPDDTSVSSTWLVSIERDPWLEYPTLVRSSIVSYLCDKHVRWQKIHFPAYPACDITHEYANTDDPAI